MGANNCQQPYKPSSLFTILASTLLLLLLLASQEAHFFKATKSTSTKKTIEATTEAPNGEHENIDNRIKSLVGDDKLGESVSRYLEVPIPRKSRSHARRFFSTINSQLKYPPNEKHFPKLIKDLLELLFENEPDKESCDSVCVACKPPARCSTCPSCPTCRPCPLPDYCKPARDGEKCPPKPECPICGEERSTTTTTTTSSTSSTTTTTTTTPSTTSTTTSTTSTTTPGPTTGRHLDHKVTSGSSWTNSSTTTFEDENGNKVTVSNFTSDKIDFNSILKKNIAIIIKTEESRRNIITIIDSIPANSSNDKLAREILDRLGKQNPLYTARAIKNRGNKKTRRLSRRETSRNNVRIIVGHLLDKFVKTKCNCLDCKCFCPECPKSCNCPNVPTCPPAPPGCPSYPPCKICPIVKPRMNDKNSDNADDDSTDDYEGKNSRGSWDDIDTSGKPVSLTEQATAKQCKGFTCSFQKSCGVANLNPLTPRGSQSGYMNGGENEIYGEWPSFARLSIRTIGPDGGEMVCGGVLITNRHVLTAGHCVLSNGRVINARSITVILGEHDKRVKDKYEQIAIVKSICKSSRYLDSNGVKYDFAILTLDRTIRFDDHVQPACLPYKPIGNLDLGPQPKCFVAGTGIIKFNHQPMGDHLWSPIVQKMPLTQVSCKNWGFWDTDRSRHCFTKPKAGGDTCGGDSGGPILCLHPQTKRWTVVGLVSYGSESCDGGGHVGWVGVYTRVRALLGDMWHDCGI